LLKPFSYERFCAALSKALDSTKVPKVSQAPSSSAASQGSIGTKASENDSLARALSQLKIYLEHIAVKIGSRTRIVPISEISYFISTDHVTQLYTSDSDYACDPSLSALEERLDPKIFLRIHRNAIVRLKDIDTLHGDTNATVTLRNGAILKVSRERKKVLREALGLDKASTP
jgi:two-component system, LytTR family, response regulator